MAKSSYEFVRLVGGERRVGPTLASVSRRWKYADERFLFISPHDDDVIIGGGLLILSSLKDKVPVHIAVVTDGSQGYCSLEEKDTISEIRRKETCAAYKTLGVKKKNIVFLGFPSCGLTRYLGRRPAKAGEQPQSHGYTGLQHAFTELLRRVRPNQVFLPTYADIHPTHRLVHSEFLISCFHASGAIWPELGKPLAGPPYIHELAVYCNFPTTPKLRVQAPMKALGRKLAAIAEFRSQRQIKSLTDQIKQAGPYEYFRPVDFSLYNPSVYRDMFEAPPMVAGVFH